MIEKTGKDFWAQKEVEETFERRSFALEMAKEAKRIKVWINIEKNWYTPEEFTALVNSLQSPPESYLCVPIRKGAIKLKDPLDAVQRMRDELNKKEQALVDFSARITKYYREG